MTLAVAGLFAGIGGVELGFERCGHHCALLSEIDPGARNVLKSRFRKVKLEGDVKQLQLLPKVDVVTAGFPCQDLSQAGRTAGITGRQSGLVGEIFRLLSSGQTNPQWLVIENVPFMLQLDGGAAMQFLVDQLEELGYAWAYRIVDSRAFGLPQRRQRVILVASKIEDPRSVLFADDAGESEEPRFAETWCGFYWTEGLRGLGWAIDSIPTLKGGSTIGIPSPPAIWNPVSGEFFTPDIRDAERLQGFTPDWTLPAAEVEGVKAAHRWKLIGNAVSVPVAEWVGKRLAEPGAFHRTRSRLIWTEKAWPKAAWGYRGEVYPVDLTAWPIQRSRPSLSEFLQYSTKALSIRAATGFLRRAKESTLRFEDGFLDALERYIKHASETAAA